MAIGERKQRGIYNRDSTEVQAQHLLEHDKKVNKALFVTGPFMLWK
jgi:hypothetical protein